MFLRNRHPLVVRLALALGAMALFAIGYQWGNAYRFRSTAPTEIRGVRIHPPAEIPEFALHDPFGRPFGRTDLAVGWTLLGVGDLAEASGQRAAQRLIEIHNRLADRPELIDSLQLVLIQTSERLDLAREFARLSPALRLLAGPPDAIAHLLEALALTRESGPTLLVIGPDTRLHAVLPETEHGADMAEDIKTLMIGVRLSALHVRQDRNHQL